MGFTYENDAGYKIHDTGYTIHDTGFREKMGK